MTEARKVKKSESLEIRLGYETKSAFMALCQAEGRTASETLRGYIEAELAPRPAQPRRPMRYLALGALAATAMAAAAAPSLARPAGGVPFERLDLDGDGAVSGGEFGRLDRDRDGRVSRAEFTGSRAGPGRP